MMNSFCVFIVISLCFGLLTDAAREKNKMAELSEGMKRVEDALTAMDSRLRSLEEAAGGRVTELERRTTQLKDDLNTKLRKLMNVVSALYELNKEMRGAAAVSQPAPSNSDFWLESLEDLERKMQEQLSVLTSRLQSDLSSLRAECRPPEPIEDEYESSSLAAASSSKARSAGNSLVEALGRSAREIRDDLKAGLQGLDERLKNMSDCAVVLQQSAALQARMVPAASVANQVIVEPPTQEPRVKERGSKSLNCSRISRGAADAKSCWDLRRGGATCDGTYVIFPDGRRAVRALCDMTTDGGGWTVILRRGDFGPKMTSFHRNWLSYKSGFGDVEGEFWLGNDVIHALTSAEQNALRVTLEAFDGERIDLQYAQFAVGAEADNYRLSVTGESSGGRASNGLRYHHNRPFSTFDRQNDGFQQNCADTYRGGWWFNGCYFAFLTGEYFKDGDVARQDWQGMLWYDWKGSDALSGAVMMVRPVKE